MMVHDDRCALAYLRSRPEVDSARIGATGMSLGGSRTTLAGGAGDFGESLRAHLADDALPGLRRQRAFSRGPPFISLCRGMLVSGLDMEHIVACTAPRSQLILTGDRDPLSPLSGIRAVMDFASAVYAEQGAADKLEVALYEGVAHAYLPNMVERMLAIFLREL